MIGNSFDSINVHLSIRRFLHSNVYSKIAIPFIDGVSRNAEELQADKYVLYHIEHRAETPGIPQRQIDLTVLVKAKFASMPDDTDGKWVTLVSDIIRTELQDAQTDPVWPTSILLYDFMGLFSQTELYTAVTSGDITTILSTLNGVPSTIGCFWVDKVYQEKLERVDNEFVHARNYRLFQYSPDMVRGL